MNLPDILRRKDRTARLLSGAAAPMTVFRRGRRRHAVELGPGSVLRLEGASQFRCLLGLPEGLHWTVSAHPGLGNFGAMKRFAGALFAPAAEFALELVEAGARRRRHTLFGAALRPFAPDDPVRLGWPHWAAREGSEYHLELSVRGERAAYVIVAPLFDARRRIIPSLRGDGVEVGPGLNPHVLPSSRVRVRYVESTPAEDWLKLYKKQDRPSLASARNLWAHYINGDGRTLPMISDGSLDFIFSNHVFEHMLDPLGVLGAWARKLRPGGVLAGVVPDLRYTFDLRQPPSRPEEWLEERDAAASGIPLAKYEKWCRYTAPYNTPEDLIARRYSIHVHYYTPETFVTMAQTLVDEGLVEAPVLHQSPNHKDFGFVMARKG